MEDMGGETFCWTVCSAPTLSLALCLSYLLCVPQATSGLHWWSPSPAGSDCLLHPEFLLLCPFLALGPRRGDGSLHWKPSEQVTPSALSTTPSLNFCHVPIAPTGTMADIGEVANDKVMGLEAVVAPR